MLFISSQISLIQTTYTVSSHTSDFSSRYCHLISLIIHFFSYINYFILHLFYSTFISYYKYFILTFHFKLNTHGLYHLHSHHTSHFNSLLIAYITYIYISPHRFLISPQNIYFSLWLSHFFLHYILFLSQTEVTSYFLLFNMFISHYTFVSHIYFITNCLSDTTYFIPSSYISWYLTTSIWSEPPTCI